MKDTVQENSPQSSNMTVYYKLVFMHVWGIKNILAGTTLCFKCQLLLKWNVEQENHSHAS